MLLPACLTLLSIAPSVGSWRSCFKISFNLPNTKKIKWAFDRESQYSMSCSFCHLNSIVSSSADNLIGLDLLYSPPPDPTDSVAQSVTRHSFSACILSLTLVLWGFDCNCQKPFPCHLYRPSGRWNYVHPSKVDKAQGTKNICFWFTSVLTRTHFNNLWLQHRAYFFFK